MSRGCLAGLVRVGRHPFSSHRDRQQTGGQAMPGRRRAGQTVAENGCWGHLFLSIMRTLLRLRLPHSLTRTLYAPDISALQAQRMRMEMPFVYGGDDINQQNIKLRSTLLLLEKPHGRSKNDTKIGPQFYVSSTPLPYLELYGPHELQPGGRRAGDRWTKGAHNEFLLQGDEMGQVSGERKTGREPENMRLPGTGGSHTGTESPAEQKPPRSMGIPKKNMESILDEDADEMLRLYGRLVARKVISISYARKLGDQPLLLAIASFKAHQVGEHEMPARRVVELYPEKQSKRRDIMTRSVPGS
ncbi:hypothetical protein TEQG_01857 [Trichophyton equinum CBS 127.97]|uniref:Uncharacterized protein n=1 Tax=Trichophyton equinum (strain ATCC MYA-4606 / CBS 127.97) TaxID=559882 RepID=F2PLQ2_TRIEC|nr:hypothetical protein TEQG_01857 [Trichophyton equinum CBS 127.97]